MSDKVSVIKTVVLDGRFDGRRHDVPGIAVNALDADPLECCIVGLECPVPSRIGTGFPAVPSVPGISGQKATFKEESGGSFYHAQHRAYAPLRPMSWLGR